MAEDLAVLVRQAAEDPQHLPDFEALVSAGRRRRVMARTTTLAAVVAVVALAGAVLSATVIPSSLPVIGEDPAVTLPDEPIPSEPSAASSQPEVGRMEAAAAEQCQQAADEFDDAMVVEAYGSPPAALWAWWLDFTGDTGSDGDRWIDPNGTDPASVCVVFADAIPAPGPPGFGRRGYQWALLVVLPDGTVRPLTASPDRPTDLPPAAADMDAGPRWEERLEWYRVTTHNSGLPVLAEAPPEQGVPALHPPAAVDPTITQQAAEEVARERFPDLDAYPERRTFLADYETFGPGSATETDPATTRRLVWVVLGAPVEMIPRGPGAAPAQMIAMVIVDAHDGSVVAELIL